MSLRALGLRPHESKADVPHAKAGWIGVAEPASHPLLGIKERSSPEHSAVGGNRFDRSGGGQEGVVDRGEAPLPNVAGDVVQARGVVRTGRRKDPHGRRATKSRLATIASS